MSLFHSNDPLATNRRVFEGQLGSFGMRTLATDDPRQAMRHLEAGYAEGDPFSLVILDYQMPAVDGVALGKQIRASEHHAQLPILLLTSLVYRGQVAEAKDVGFDAYLVKPVKRDNLFDACLTLLGAGRGGRRGEAMLTDFNLPETQGRRRRILVVEDNAINQRVAQSTLTKLGFYSDVAANGLEAVEAVQQMPYDLVLMDCNMPELDGYEATRRLRRLGVRQHRMPVIAMTANALEGDREACLEAGMNDHLAKPVTLENLSEMLERWLPTDADGSPSPGTRRDLPA